MKPRMEKTTLVILIFSGLSSVSAYFSREYYYVNMTMSWPDAQSYCRAGFDDLATVDNDYDNQRLLTLAQDSDASGYIWIGRYDDVTIWKWSMEEKDFNFATVANFLTWLSGQPNNKDGNQYCVVYYNSQTINDLGCGEAHPFICYDDSGSTNYVLVKQQLSWPEARTYCRETHTDLVSIHSNDENNNILSILTASGVGTAWIGLYRDPWAFWSDKSTSTFTNWNLGEPNGVYEYCAALYAVSGKWLNDVCDRTVPFFCFKGVTSQTVLRLEIASVARLFSADIQQQLVQQLQRHIASSGVTNFNILWRNVQRRQSTREDGEC